MTHWEQLNKYISLSDATILDLGSGRGDFLIEAAKEGGNVTGLEINPHYIELSKQKAAQSKVSISVVQGKAEELPFADYTFDFINICEVIEHVDDPQQMLREVYRVLKPGGEAYLSVPNRFGFRDQHFHLYMVNWLPRAWSDRFISTFSTHKNYSDMAAGRQRLRDMHYYTFSGVTALLRAQRFEPIDIRAQRIKNEFSLDKWWGFLYSSFFRPFYFDAFHLLLRK